MDLSDSDIRLLKALIALLKKSFAGAWFGSLSVDAAPRNDGPAGTDAVRTQPACEHKWRARWQQSLDTGEIRWKECEYCGEKR